MVPATPHESTVSAEGRRSPTLADVADAAGVSLSTASLAFSGNKPVATPTRERVLAAAAGLGYAGPNPVARSLRQGRTGVVGVVVGQRLIDAFRDPVEIALLDGISEVLGAAGQSLLLLADARAGADLVEPARSLALDGVVFANCGLESEPSYDEFRARGVPMVAVEGPYLDGVTVVDIRHRDGTVALARHLRELGHERVACVSLPMRYRCARERLLGLHDVYPDAPHLEADNDLDLGRAAARELLDVAHPPTAIVAQSDLLAAGVVQEARARGLAVPGDLSVAGFDGVPTPWLDARLTTVVQPMQQKGRLAAEAALARIVGERADDVLLDVELRVGDTTGPAPRT